MRPLIATLLLAAACGAAQAGPRGPLTLLRITPAGEDVPAERQIVFQFDRDVVPLGRMQRSAAEIPITIEPDPHCEWRWLDRSALACQLTEEHALLPATRYTIEVRPGLAAADGSTLAAPVRQTFLTRRPAVDNAWFREWLSPHVPELQLVLNQDVTEDSLRRHLSFVAPNARIGVEARQEGSWRDGEDEDEGGEYGSGRPSIAWIVKPASDLPPDSPVALHVEPGLVPLRGSVPGIERRDVLTFRTFPAPRFLGVRCADLRGKPQRIASAEAAQIQRCDPLQAVELLFSSPVGEDVLRDHLRVAPPLGSAAASAAWNEPYSRLQYLPEVHEYEVTLPGPLAAATEYRLTASASALEDQLGRRLPLPLDFRFRTDHRKPALVLSHPVSVLESQVPTRLPVVVTNLDRVRARFDRVTASGVASALTRDLAIPRAPDIAFRHPLDVREWLGGASGAVVGSITSEPPTGPAQWFFSEVTPFAVHVKAGHHNTLVWVTDLASGEPVAEATVEVVEQRIDRFSTPGRVRASGRTDREGSALLAGSEELDPATQLVGYWRDRSAPHLVVRVASGDRLALVPLVQEFRVQERGPNDSWIAAWRKARHGHLRAWGVTAQGIYRAGDTVQYKIWVRESSNETLVPAPASTYALKVIDPLDAQVHERTGLSLSAFGTLDGELKLPATGAVGWYRFELRADFAPNASWQPLTVLVSDFTPAPFRVTTDLDAALYRAGDTVGVTTRALLHGGGPYVDARTRVTATVRSAPFTTKDPALGGFTFDVDAAEAETIHGGDAVLDGDGQLEVELPPLAPAIVHGELIVESAVRDDRGKSVAARATARYAGRDRYVGIRQQDWVLRTGTPASFAAVVVDEQEQRVAGVSIHFTVERLKTQASRVKGAGNAYVTQYIQTWEEHARCDATSALEPVVCEFTPGEPGEYRLTAAIEDAAGRPVASQLWRWVAGPGVVLWEEPPGHHLQIVPEQETLRVGETARYLIKNPFPGARALVTIERLGVIRHWTTILEGSTPILEVPVEPAFIPGFHLSVVVTSPRVERPPGDGNVDLGKPAFRMGYARTEVRDAYKELAVEVVASAPVVKPRETVTIDVQAGTRQGETPPMELAVTVLDEAVLDLLAQGAPGFDPYRALYELDALDLWNFNLLKNLVGMQKFEKKGATPGGDGGLDPALRSVFKFVSYWNPSLATDADGHARFEFVVPDNLTAWRVLVMASTPADRFGLGQTSVRVNLPTEVRSALPNQLVEGDRFEARFTVMNRTDRSRRLRVEGAAAGAVRKAARVERVIEAAPFARTTIALPVEAAGPGTIRLTLRAGDGQDEDGLSASVPVRPRAALETAAEHGTTAGAAAEEVIAFPRDMRDDVGGLAVTLSPTILGDLDGAFRYMRDYPYLCWEQILSKGVMAAHYRALRDWLPPDLDWPEAGTLPQRTLDRAADFQTPSGAMSFYRPLDDDASPYLSAYTALAFVWLRDLGYAVPAGVEQKLQAYLGELLRRDTFPPGFTRAMTASVRALALSALAQAGRAGADDVARHGAHVEAMDLFGRAHYLRALIASGAPPETRRRLVDAILAHASESAGQIAFSEPLDDGFERMLHSPARTGCAVLEALVAHGEPALAGAGMAELPAKLVRSLTAARGRRAHWANTQENVFCTAALVAYAKAYERTEPAFAVTATLERELLGRARFEGRRAPAARLARPVKRADRGRTAQLRLAREGEGRLYYGVTLATSPLVLPATPVNAGIEVRRTYAVQRDGRWVALDGPSARVEQGDLVRVELDVVAPGPRNFVVVDDPLPGGLEPVNRDLATASAVDADATSDWTFYHRELRHDFARFYSEHVPPGSYRLTYVAQVIAPGTFTSLPAHAEEMYDPDVFGRSAPGQLTVGAGPPER